MQHLLQAFSSDSSLQSGLSLQNNSFSIHSPLPHDNLPSGQTGSSVLRIGKTLRGSVCVRKVIHELKWKQVINEIELMLSKNLL